MTEPPMPTSLPSPVDRGEFGFFAVDPLGTVWRWINDEMIWVRVPRETGTPDAEPGRDLVH